jgi:hypothetical protein
LRAVLQPAASLSGRVLDPRGAPVDGARVRAWRAGENPDAPESYRPCLRNEGAADTDGEGRFTLDALPPGWWTLRSRDGRFLDATREHLHLSEGERLRGIELTLGEAGMVSGRVLTAEGEPAGETQVQANGRPAPPVSVAGDGGYRIEGVQPGEQTLEAWGPGGERASGRLVVRPGENHLDLKLGPAGKRHEIRGRVTGPGGEPIGSAEVQAGGSPATLQTSTASDGGFDLSVGDGDYTLSARKPGYAAGDATVHVAGAPVDGIEIRLGRAGALTGHLAGLAPRDLRIAKIEAAGSGEARFDGLVSSEGSYSIPDLPSGNWEVTARAGNRSAAGTVQLPEGEAEAVLDLTFPPTSEVSGWVLGPDGEPVADAAVRLFNPGGPGLSTRTRPDGGFRLEAEDGTYRLLSYKEGYLSATREEPVTVGGEPVSDLELHLGAAATVRGRILGLAPWDRAQGIVASNGAGLVSVGKLDFEGGYALPGLRPGTWEIAARHGDRQAIARIEILPGQTEVDLDLDFPAP